MGIDKETVPTYISIVLDNNPEYVKELKDQANEDGQNDLLEGGNPKPNRISLTMNKHSFEMEEYYYDERDNELNISGSMRSGVGESFVSICIPLSDTVLIDILQEAIKRLNKLKVATEALK